MNECSYHPHPPYRECRHRISEGGHHSYLATYWGERPTRTSKGWIVRSGWIDSNGAFGGLIDAPEDVAQWLVDQFENAT